MTSLRPQYNQENARVINHGSVYGVLCAQMNDVKNCTIGSNPGQGQPSARRSRSCSGRRFPASAFANEVLFDAGLGRQGDVSSPAQAHNRKSSREGRIFPQLYADICPFSKAPQVDDTVVQPLPQKDAMTALNSSTSLPLAPSFDPAFSLLDLSGFIYISLISARSSLLGLWEALWTVSLFFPLKMTSGQKETLVKSAPLHD
jgi:hypothetical protein